MRIRAIGSAFAVAATAFLTVPLAPIEAQTTWSGFSATNLVPKVVDGQPVYRPTWGLGVVSNPSGSYDVVTNNHAFATGIWQDIGRPSQNYAETNQGTALRNAAGNADSHGIRVADFDNDGDQDFIEFVGDPGRDGSGLNRYFSNNGDDTYTYRPDNGTGYGFSRGRLGVPFDVDLDGDLDIMVAGLTRDDDPIADGTQWVLGRNTILLNDSTKSDTDTNPTKFNPIGNADDILENFLNVGSVTNWGPGTDSDLLALNSFGFPRKVVDAVNGQSTAISLSNPQPPMVSADKARDWVLGDFDGDLKPELLIVRDNRGFNGDAARDLMYYDLSANGTASLKSGLPGSADIDDCAVGAAGDYDNDGDLDVFLGCSETARNRSNLMLMNDGAGNFSIGAAGLLPNAGLTDAENAVVFDANGDGSLDIYLGNGFEANQEPDKLLVNNPTSNNWLQVDLVGTVDNNDAIGAAMYIGSSEGWQARQVGHAFHKGSDALTLHYGLGSDNALAPVLVTWPNGMIESFDIANVNQRVSLVQGQGTPANLNALNSAPVVPGDPDPDPDPDPQFTNCRRAPVNPAFDTADATKASVYRLYCSYFLRYPDQGGFDFWFTTFSNGTMNLDEISNFFATSDEFTATYGTLTNRQFVELIYANILERPAEQGGFDFWLSELDNGNRTRGQIMLFFSQSDEFKAKTGTN